MPNRLSVLIVDDESSMRTLFERLLPIIGYRVAGSACNGVDAVEMARGLQPDLVIMDIKMPEMNGLDAASQILAERQVPIIICSGALNPENRSRATNLGVRAFLSKPFTLDGLRGALALDGARVQALPAAAA